MRIPLDRTSKVPLYRQIENYLRQGIILGSLAPETRLPASRLLSRDLGVNRITVETAYAELEADGLLYSRVGSGTYVLPPLQVPPLPPVDSNEPWPLWQHEIPAADKVMLSMMPSETSEPKLETSMPIYFSYGTSDSRLFPIDKFRKTIQAVMRRDGLAAVEFCEVRGYGPLRTSIAHILGSQGLQTRPENILITTGSQQGIALVAQLLLKPGDTVLVENPTYVGALALFRTLGLKIVGIPMDEHGLQVDKTEKRLQQHHPKLIYTIPTFQNPTGVCLSIARRRQLIALADRFNVPILEDDFVGDLRYEGRAQPALKAMDPGGRIIYVSTFSKMLMSGLRLGFLVADGPVYESLVNFKCVNDLTTSILIQRVLESFVTVGRYQAHLRRSCQIYRKRRDIMLEAIHRYFPESVRVIPPQGGLFIWARLPDTLSSDQLLPLAREEGVTFNPGRNFFVEGGERNHFLRLNFAVHAPDEIEEGIRRLAKAIRRLEKTN